VKADPFLACDVIAGFPGETEADFEETFSLCQRVGFAWIHAFPYSPRPGTEAALFKDRVPEREAVARVERLLNLGREVRRVYVGRWIGKDVEAIVENKRDRSFAVGVSENYLKLLIPLPAPGGTTLRCRLKTLSQDAFDALAYPV
jgi:threonylcarbamoyladenosine tRNA methylthiotransferase MtaB